jgi:hypothetical protein
MWINNSTLGGRPRIAENFVERDFFIRILFQVDFDFA